MKKIIITRKIKLNINLPKDTEEKQQAYDTLYAYQRYTFRAANLISTHNFLQEKMKDMIYLTEEAKVKLADVEKNEDGILNTSKLNTTYRIVSKEFLGKLPSTILTSLNTVVTQSYNAEKKEYYTGQRSLRNYRNNIPIPFQKKSMRDFKHDLPTNNFTFTLFKIPFITYLGVDRSDNRSIIKRILSGEYDMGDSSLQLKDGKIFLLMVVKFDKHPIKLDPEKVVTAKLDWDYPIIAKIKRKEHFIGRKEEYVHRRLQIQNAIQRAQKAARYNVGGRGRKKKLKSLDFYHEKEKNFVSQKMHLYSYELIKYAKENGAGKIKLINIPDSEQLKEEEPLLLRNWSYYGLIEKIKYKANKFGIEVEEE